MRDFSSCLCLLLVACLSCPSRGHSPAAGVPDDSLQAPSTFVIRGQARNMEASFWEFGFTGFYDYSRVSIPLQDDGSFSKTLPLEHPQDVHLFLNNSAVPIFAVPGDTITLEWDNNDFLDSFKIHSPNSGRQQELDLMWACYKSFWHPFMQLARNLAYARQEPDSSKVRKIGDLYSQEMRFIASRPATRYTEKIVCDIYFRYIKIMDDNRLLPHYALSLAGFWAGKPITVEKIHHTILHEPNFYLSPNYRDFLFDRILIAAHPFGDHILKHGSEQEDIPPILGDCHVAMAVIPVRSIREWFIAKSIMLGFEHYSFEDAEDAYLKFIPEIRGASVKDTLEKYYARAQSLRRGTPAPDFTLRDAAGKEVSLSDFRGKVVYIDFWGVYCGPCRADLKESTPKLHEKYKDREDLVFINVCVDVGEEGWKKGIAELDVKGVNLLAKGGTRHPVCRSYNIGAIPHYVLIDKEGKIANNNAPRPHEFLGEHENDLDRLLK